jgi:hypothetical protein
VKVLAGKSSGRERWNWKRIDRDRLLDGNQTVVIVQLFLNQTVVILFSPFLDREREREMKPLYSIYIYINTHQPALKSGTYQMTMGNLWEPILLILVNSSVCFSTRGCKLLVGSSERKRCSNTTAKSFKKMCVSRQGKWKTVRETVTERESSFRERN